MSDNNDIPPPPPPPPPPQPGDGFNPSEMFQQEAYDRDQQMESGKPAVAANPTRVFVVLGIMGIILLFLLYNIFFSGKPKVSEVDPQPSVVTPDNRPANDIIPLAPIVPEDIPDQPPLPTPPIPVPTQTPTIDQKQDETNNKALLDRLKSNMLIMNAGGSLFGGKTDSENAEDQLAGLDPNAQFGNLVTRSNTKAARAVATHIGNLNLIIAQGRVIQATLETAINTDLPGPIRAIVSRDIYGEAGEYPLIPKGSRLIGQYNSNIIAGQSRVYVMWTRVIRPDGVDVAIGSPLIDQIGQAGVGGYVDNKFREMFSRAVLASVFSIATAYGVEQISDEDQQTTSTSPTTGFFSQSGGTASSATVNSLNRLGSTTASFISRFINVKPTILVDQGSKVMVFVNRDLIFPSQYVGPQSVE